MCEGELQGGGGDQAAERTFSLVGRRPTGASGRTHWALLPFGGVPHPRSPPAPISARRRRDEVAALVVVDGSGRVAADAVLLFRLFTGPNAARKSRQLVVGPRGAWIPIAPRPEVFTDVLLTVTVSFESGAAAAQTVITERSGSHRASRTIAMT